MCVRKVSVIPVGKILAVIAYGASLVTAHCVGKVITGSPVSGPVKVIAGIFSGAAIGIGGAKAAEVFWNTPELNIELDGGEFDFDGCLDQEVSEIDESIQEVLNGQEGTDIYEGASGDIIPSMA